ncbi:MAG: NAD(P)-dependent oxidoreductase [Alphaproteobacteria bacterium]|nr:NAD(P)-dependent oxidoreductase [Alphaproteobacteria bacterium]
MKVLLTGHRGYIGTVLTPMLQDRGHEVYGMDSDLYSGSTFTGEIIDVPGSQKDCRDATAADLTPDRLGGFDAVIHLAGLSNDPLGDYQPGLTDDINASASIHLAKLAKAAGVPRFLFASSCSNYGAAGQDFLTESAAFNPVTPYGWSKVKVEQIVGPMADETFSPTFLRASTAYGLSPRLRFDLVVNNLTAWAFSTGEVRMKSDGMPWRPIVHVEDIARAYVASLEADRTDVHNEAFNVGTTSENYRVLDIAEIVGQVVPGSRVTFADDASPDTRNYRVDCNYIARKLPGFKPQWTCRRGVEELYDTFCKVGVTVDEFEGDRFKRIAQIKKLISEGKLDSNLRWRQPTYSIS